MKLNVSFLFLNSAKNEPEFIFQQRQIIHLSNSSLDKGVLQLCDLSKYARCGAGTAGLHGAL